MRITYQTFHVLADRSNKMCDIPPARCDLSSFSSSLRRASVSGSSHSWPRIPRDSAGPTCARAAYSHATTSIPCLRTRRPAAPVGHLSYSCIDSSLLFTCCYSHAQGKTLTANQSLAPWNQDCDRSACRRDLPGEFNSSHTADLALGPCVACVQRTARPAYTLGCLHYQPPVFPCSAPSTRDTSLLSLLLTRPYQTTPRSRDSFRISY